MYRIFIILGSLHTFHSLHYIYYIITEQPVRSLKPRYTRDQTNKAFCH